MTKKKFKYFFSIIIPVLNNRVGLEKTLKSIVKQRFKNYEIIIIDGGSKDGTDKIVKKYRKIAN